MQIRTFSRVLTPPVNASCDCTQLSSDSDFPEPEITLFDQALKSSELEGSPQLCFETTMSLGGEAACSLQIYNLSMLEERLKAMYRSVTEGRFSEALRQVNTILHIIPLTVVDSRREVDEVKELISIARSVPQRGQGGQAGLGFSGRRV